MEYLLSFLEGIITFISPCILPMFPIYLSYFSETDIDDISDTGLDSSKKAPFMSPVIKKVLGFTLGFTLVFTLLGAFAGTLGVFLTEHQRAVSIVAGIIIVIFGLHFTGLLNIEFLNKTKKLDFKKRKLGFFSSLLFGIVFSIGWTPCVGVFLGSALMLAASQGSVIKGTFMLLLYSLGLAVPFLLSAIFIERLKSTFNFIKKHYKAINIIAGSLLIIVGITMIFGWFGYLMGLLTF